MWKEILFTIILFALSFVPFLGLVCPLLIILIQSYYSGLGAMDYYLERHYNMQQSIAYGSKNRGVLTGIGLGFVLTLFVPFLGFLFAPLLSTIATTEYGCKNATK